MDIHIRRVHPIRWRSLVLLASLALTGMGTGSSRVFAEDIRILSPEVSHKSALLQKVGIVDKTGEFPKTSFEFTDSNGERKLLLDYFGKSPVIVSPVYFRCPTVCNPHIQSLLGALQGIQSGGDIDFPVLFVSINPKETVQDAVEKKKIFLAYHPNLESITYLTGRKEEIERFTQELGFFYQWDPESQQYIHGAVMYVFSAEGRLVRILQGAEFSSRDTKLALVEAKPEGERTGGERLALYFFQFEPRFNRYNLRLTSVFTVWLGGTVLVVLGFGIAFLKKFRHRRENSLRSEQTS